MRDKYLPIVLLLFMSACDNVEDDVKGKTIPKEIAANTQLKPGIHLQNMDNSIRPGDDFFEFVNGTWLASTEIPADRSSIGSFDLLQDSTQENVRDIIETASTISHPTGSDEQKVGDLYTSYLDIETRNSLGVKPLHKIWSEIDAIADYEGLATFFALANKRGYEMPFTLDQFADFSDPTTYMMYTWQGGLGLPDREYYSNVDEKSVEIRRAYQNHVEMMLTKAGLNEPTDSAALVMELESRMAAVHMLKEDTRDYRLTYNPIPLDELNDLMPSFNWKGYLEAADITDIDTVNITMLDHMKALDSIITSVPISDWKIWLKWAVLNGAATRLNEDLDKEHFAFYGKVLRGQEEQRPLWRRGVAVVNENLGQLVGKVYVKKHFSPEAKSRMLEMVHNLVDAYEISIKRLDWMSEETRQRALIKLSKFTPNIGYPDKWRDYSPLQIDKNNLFGNIEATAVFEYKRKIDRQMDTVDRSEWDSNPQTVNAYYSPPHNSITFPAGILQPPFFDVTADDAVNYGGIGAVIGHEIGHGFDDEGSRFDGDGVLRNWWKDQDRAEFEVRTRMLVQQYSAFKPFDDLAVNGEFTLGENIGDVGGVSIALLAYQLSLDGKPAPILAGYTGKQRLFIGYGQVWLHKQRTAALRNQIATDPHAPAQYRVNGVVRNVPEFYEAFDVVESDRLFLPEEARVKIW